MNPNVQDVIDKHIINHTVVSIEFSGNEDIITEYSSGYKTIYSHSYYEIRDDNNNLVYHGLLYIY